VCFKSAEGAASQATRVEIRDLLALDPGTTAEFETDEYGFTWVTCRRADLDLTTLTTQLHGVNTTLDDAGLGSSLLCTVSGFASSPVDGPERLLGLVYSGSPGRDRARAARPPVGRTRPEG
jgi:hypothetical protein